MTAEQLKKVHQARPFVPFTLHSADGRSVRVRHPEYLAYSPVGRAAIVFDDSGDWSVLDLLLVTRIEVHASPAQGGEAAA